MKDSQSIQQHFSDYQLIRMLGENVFSEVYLAEHRQHHRQVAIKLLRGQGIGDVAQRFLAQTTKISQVRHAHIVPILDFGVENSDAFLVMDYAPGGNLHQRHPKGTSIPLESILSYLKQTAAGLQYIHEQGLVHRDIKPHNMLLAADGRVLLSDFGTVISSSSLDPSQTYDFEGTVLYAAPEQLQGKARRRSDQYALAVVIYAWLSGDWLFSGSFHEIAHQHLFIDPPALQERGITCPANIEQVLRRALEKAPEKRFPSVKMFADELEWAYKVALAKGLPGVETPLLPPTAEAHLDISPPAAPQPEQIRRQFKSPRPFNSKAVN